MTHRVAVRMALSGLMLVLTLTSGPAPAEAPIRAKIARLAFPSLVTMMVDVVKDQGLDRKNGIDLEAQTYGAISAFYAPLATGEADMTAAGPPAPQKTRNEGAPTKARFTYPRP